MNNKSKNGRRVITYSESVSIGSFCQKALFSFAGDSLLTEDSKGSIIIIYLNNLARKHKIASKLFPTAISFISKHLPFCCTCKMIQF